MVVRVAWLLTLALGAARYGAAQPLVVDFEAGIPASAQVSGEVSLETANVHAGQAALRVNPGGEVLIPVADEDGFGTVSLWVFDSGLALGDEEAKQRLFGPLWGLSNRADQRLCFGLIYAPYLSGNASYGWISTAENQWSARRYARAPRSAGWRHFVFTVNNEADIVVTVDDREATGFDTITSRFFRGFSGVYLRGSQELSEPLIVDDLEVSWQKEPLTERLRPLPGEVRALTDVEPLPLRPELVGAHPRLFFTAADIPGLRARCATTHADFFQRLISGADGYLGMMPPTNASEVNTDQLMQQWAWWRLQTLAFSYVVTGDERYGRHALDWMETFASWPQWGSGEETDQSMGAANMLTGMACAYDWLHGLMTEEQRVRFRDKLFEQVQRLCWLGFMDATTAGYWKHDHQNNHMHHRLSGLLLGALAVHGEVPAAESYASFAAEQCRAVAAALPPDGSNHEGPHYTDFGFSYVVRCFEALRHCTGIDLYAETPGLRGVPTFRTHLLTPGFTDVFNLGDCGRGTYYFGHYLFRLAAEYRDGAAQTLLDAAYRAAPGAFMYYPWCILWYDPDLERVPFEQIPRSHYFEDLELATYRSSWSDADALAVVLKCGPYGGHRLNDLGAAWVNVAHDHPDPNHFMLYWRGRMWITDDGYARRAKLGENHNIILVDGQGPAHRGGAWSQPIANMGTMGRIDAVTEAEGLFAARGDATAYYLGMDAALRWLAVVDDRWVIICDRLSSPQPHRYEWLLHSDAQWTQEGPGAFELSADGETLHLRLALPEAVATRVERDHREQSEGMRLVASPPEPAPGAVFVAVLAMEPIPALTASATDEAIAVTISDGPRLSFDVQAGAVTVERP